MTLADKRAGLTEKQRAIYDYIRAEIVAFRGPPSIRQIGKRFGIGTPNGVVGHLKALEANALIRRDGGTISLVDPPRCPHCCKAYTDPQEPKPF